MGPEVKRFVFLDAADYDPALKQGATVAAANVANELDTADLADGAVTTAKLAADAVDGTKIADDAIDSEHYTDGSIDTAHLAADAVDGTKLADNAVSLEHLDAAITPSHIVVYAGEFTTAGGDTDETISVPGVVATDLVHVTLHTAGASPVTIVDASAGTDQIDVDMSADPSTDHVLTYSVLRAAA